MTTTETSIVDEARTEAVRRWTIHPHGVTDTRDIPRIERDRDRFVEGAEWQASRTARVESQAEFDALPVGTLIEVAFHGHAESTQILRVNDNGASAGNASLRGGKFWSEVWGWAESVTVLYRPGALK